MVANKTHGETYPPTLLYRVWGAMKQRCFNRRSQWFADYGGRGITVCDEWKTYEPFRDWARTNGYNPGLSLDRIDVNDDYKPDNCRWATPHMQGRSRRQNRWLTAFGETKIQRDWANDPRCPVTDMTISARLARGMSAEEAIARPPTRSNGYRKIQKGGR